MIFLPTTHFKVLERTQDFPLDFQVTHRADYIVVLMNSNNETYSISPLVIEQRLRQGRIKVIAFPAHPSHGIDIRGRDAGCQDQCRQCMLLTNEEQIQFECALPAREILGPDSFGGEDGRHSPAAATLRLHLDREDPWRPVRQTGFEYPDDRPTHVPPSVLTSGPIETVCPACVAGNPVLVRLCVTHQNCDRCGNPKVIICPTCLEPKA